MSDVVILDGARTAIGSFLGGLAKVSATQLGAVAARGALARSGVPGEAVDAVYMGNVIQSSKDAAYLARHVALDAGVPVDRHAMTVSRACGSGLDSVILGAKDLRLGEARVVLAGGAENMSMTPYAMRGVRQGWRMIKTDVDDMLFSALHDPKAGCSIGETVEHLAQAHGVSRADADELAVWGQARAKAALDAGRLAEQIVPVEIPSRRGARIVDQDEGLRPDTSLEGLAALPGLYGREGVVTAGNSCGLNDAGAAVLMSTAEHAAAQGWPTLGRVLGWAAVGVPPIEMGRGPIAATRLALERAGRRLDQMDVIELNDSFTVQYRVVEKELGLDRSRVNPDGGAIALGHPMGATGTRLILSALYSLRRRGGGHALCTLCVGGGQGVAVVLEA